MIPSLPEALQRRKSNGKASFSHRSARTPPFRGELNLHQSRWNRLDSRVVGSRFELGHTQPMQKNGGWESDAGEYLALVQSSATVQVEVMHQN